MYRTATEHELQLPAGLGFVLRSHEYCEHCVDAYDGWPGPHGPHNKYEHICLTMGRVVRATWTVSAPDLKTAAAVECAASQSIAAAAALERGSVVYGLCRRRRW